MVWKRSKTGIIENEIARKAGIKDHIGCHMLRKTFGYHYYKMTQDVVSLSAYGFGACGYGA